MNTLPTLRDKIADAISRDMWVNLDFMMDGVDDAADHLLRIIANHIEWSDADDCMYGHVYSECGEYEITNGFTLYASREELSQHETLNEAKRGAQVHKETP